ncbi:MAG: branched-chain amino acid ABC transporter permease [Candidatus Solibacter sp.]|nr:branched-chain amino acid ABC transporter permease [Candidatus Solibacter sp.]
MNGMEQYLANGICRGSVYGLVAMGFGLIYVSTGVFHLAHAAVCAFASYAAYFALRSFRVHILVAILAAGVVAALIGLLIDLLVYRPLQQRAAPPATLMISSLGANVFLTGLLTMLFTTRSIALSQGPEPTHHFYHAILTSSQVYQLITFGLISTIYVLLMKYSRLGQLCRALADNASLAATIGFDVSLVRAGIFAVGSFIAGLGAALQALEVGVEPTGGMPLMLFAIAACIAGGLRRTLGPVLGALLLASIQTTTTAVLGSTWEAGSAFAVLILLLIYRPEGILSLSRRLEER